MRKPRCISHQQLPHYALGCDDQYPFPAYNRKFRPYRMCTVITGSQIPISTGGVLELSFDQRGSYMALSLGQWIDRRLRKVYLMSIKLKYCDTWSIVFWSVNCCL